MTKREKILALQANDKKIARAKQIEEICKKVDDSFIDELLAHQTEELKKYEIGTNEKPIDKKEEYYKMLGISKVDIKPIKKQTEKSKQKQEEVLKNFIKE